MQVSPSDLVRGRRYSIIVGDNEPDGPTHRSIYNVIFKGVWKVKGHKRLCFESDYVYHLVERENLLEIEPWRIQL